ncbi:hydantoinase/oxoprolinase family protein [Lutimaribacter marinistellae]|uniref:Hydantoinase/oxoprolinase family protein n=1 Tax=Lutimaribacter marinistellae TaxID=1820329 RepID=A0ABV7T9P0_9RHOB
MTHADGLRLSSDIGGTFTDTVLMSRDLRVLATAKTPTTTGSPALGAIEGARRVLDAAGARWDQVTGKIHGTTLATNALIERRGARVATITTEGFRDILEIAYERRYAQYAINLVKPDLIVPRDLAFTIGGRIDAFGQERKPLDEGAIAALAARLEAAQVEAVAICLLHSYANPAQERRLRQRLADLLPDLVISLSHEVSPEAREFDRLCTTIANAYIQPLMARYLADFEARFGAEGLRCPVLLMTAGGGMTTLETAARLPIRLVESGPAGGAILAARMAMETGEDSVLSFDMGGTTAKLCMIDAGRPQTARRFEIARAERFIKGSGMPVRIPVIEMIEIGAGGGSIACVDRLGRVQIGPQSAGSEPGPAAFGKGGTRATVTDADIALGLIEPGRFAEGRLQISPEAAEAALKADLGDNLGLNARDAAFAVSDIVDENMANAGRMHAVESGKDLSTRVMIAFGGNGPLHATRVGRRARIRRILIPRDPGVGSAIGFLHAPVSFEIVRSRYATLETLCLDALNGFFTEMEAEAERVVRAGAPDAELTQRRAAFMRYHGQGHEIEIELPPRAMVPGDLDGLKEAFDTEYRRQFSRPVPGMQIEILNWGITLSTPVIGHECAPEAIPTRRVSARETREITCDLTGERRAAGLFERAALVPGDRVIGPALIVEPQTTTLVSADFRADIDAKGNIWLTRQEKEPS